MPGLNSDDWVDWIEYAEADKREAEEAFARSAWSEACFHAQQACEKLLKAFLLAKGIFLPIHDLGRLVDEVSTFLGGLRGLRNEVDSLTAHYYAARYPDAARRLGVSYGRGVAEACLSAMKKLWSILRPHLRP